jgi:hypothetical protein
MRVEPDALEALASRLLLREVEQESAIASALRRRCDRYVVEEHGGGFWHEDEHPHNPTILQHMDPPSSDQGCIVVQHRSRLPADPSDVAARGRANDGLDVCSIGRRSKADGGHSLTFAMGLDKASPARQEGLEG